MTGGSDRFTRVDGRKRSRGEDQNRTKIKKEEKEKKNQGGVPDMRVTRADIRWRSWAEETQRQTRAALRRTRAGWRQFHALVIEKKQEGGN